MEKDLTVKVTVTRLRRRASVDSDDVKSPSTPTKKRGGRLAAKPDLELINENATENVPKRVTRKSVARDSVEVFDDKPVTPSRRSARIRSNTSILSEITQSHESPRAKRAARRTSQVGSDNEAPVTPARLTRRTRKDSSGVEKQAGTVSGDTITEQVAEVIVEEPENNLNEANKDDKSSNNSSIIRKSPRLKQKDDNVSKPHSEHNDQNKKQEDTTLSTSIHDNNSKQDKPINNTESAILSPLNIIDITPEHNYCISTSNLLNNMNKESKVKKNILNNTDSAISKSEYIESKRRRTHSWTTITVATTKNDSFHSDSETSKKKNIGKDKFLYGKSLLNEDGQLNNITKKDNKDVELNKEEILLSKNKYSITSDSTESTIKFPPSNISKDLNKSTTDNDICMENDEGNLVCDKSLDNADSSEMEALLKKVPKDIQTVVFIEDSDSNTGSIEKPSMILNHDGEDQCVPVVDHPLQIIEISAKGLENSVSYEPMDIDETIPENVTITDHVEKSTIDDKCSNSKQPLSSFTSVETNKETTNNLDRKSHIDSQNLETSSNENKSTLILSQIKDVSANHIDSISKSPKIMNKEVLSESFTVPNNTKETDVKQNLLSTSVNVPNVAKEIDKKNLLSKSFNVPDVAKEKEDKQNFAVNYSTSTPLQQKSIKLLGMQIDTSNIIHNADSNTGLNDTKNTSKKRVSNLSKSSNYSHTSEENQSKEISFKEKGKIIDDEAEEASDDYESGDSRDEDERKYEEENEIIHKGETLDSEDEYSNDTDYEKDSFVVSSDEEDNDLLSGSGDDLSMSDNELTMSAKSKKKYNDRKYKEQKKASKEMYKARHKLYDSDNSLKKVIPKSKKAKSQRLDSFLLDSEDEATVKTKKDNQQPLLDSSHGSAICKSSDDEDIGRKKKKSKRLSESICDDNAGNEKVITICNNSISEKFDPLAMAVKLEPKTPQNKFNISTTLFTNTDQVEEIDIDENVSVIKPNKTSDPLQATTEYNDSCSSSDNLELVENYESLLNNLNNKTEKQIKSVDTSLNVTTKTKQKKKEPIIDQLNLTQTNKSKVMLSIENTEEFEPSQKKKNASKTIMNKDEDEESSSSIDMRLLFPEDSNDSEAVENQSKQKNKVSHSPVEDFIPLKRTVAKTNIPGSNLDISTSKDESLLNVSKQKNIKRKSSQGGVLDNMPMNDQQGNDVNFFIDTKGSLCLDTPVNIKLTGSLKENKNNNSISDNKDLEDEMVPPEIYSLSDKKKKNKNKRFSVNLGLKVEESHVEIECHNENNKRKQNHNLSYSNDCEIVEVLVETDCQSEKKKKKNSISEKDLAGEVVLTEIHSHSEKKKKHKKKSISDNFDFSNEESPVESNKKNLNNNLSYKNDCAVDEMIDEVDCQTEKKKKKKKSNISDNKDFPEEIRTSEMEYPSGKKNKNKKNSISDNNYLQNEDTAAEDELQSEKKKKKKKIISDNIDLEDNQQELSPSFIIDTIGSQCVLDTSGNTIFNQSLNTSNKKNKNNSFSESKDLESEKPIIEVSQSDKKKKKNKKMLDSGRNHSGTPGDESDEAPTEMTYHSEKNKKKYISGSENSQGYVAGETSAKDIPVETEDQSDKKKKKTKKLSENSESNKVIQVDEIGGKSAKSLNTSLPTNTREKKKKMLSQSLNLEVTEETGNTEAFQNISVDNAKMRKRKNSARTVEEPSIPNIVQSSQEEGISLKKRKRTLSADTPKGIIIEDVMATNTADTTASRQNKKPKISYNYDKAQSGSEKNVPDTQSNEEQTQNKKSKKHKKTKSQENSEVIEEENVKQNTNKKRKERDDDSAGKKAKVLKENSFDKIHVSRLPASILNQLDERPKKELVEKKKPTAISTTQFIVEKAEKRKTKPSNYLEESIYLNDSPVVKKHKNAIKKPRVLPFIPTASTSENGYTSSFKVNVIPHETQFVAKTENVTNFKNDHLQAQRVKKLGTLERYKKHRNIKISKF